MNRIAWIVIGVVGWTLLCVAFSLVLTQPTVLCPAVLPLDPQDPIAVCLRLMATQENIAMAGPAYALFALWSGGLMVATVLARRKITRSDGRRNQENVSSVQRGY